MRRNFDEASKIKYSTPKSRVPRSTPFKFLLSFCLVASSAVMTWIGLLYFDMVQTESSQQATMRTLDQEYQALTERLAAEAAVRSAVSAEAKTASDTALETGASPEAETEASDKGGRHNNPSKIDVVVNKKHPVNPIMYTPVLEEVTCADGDSAEIHPLSMNDLMALCEAAEQNGTPLGITSSYRSYEEQIAAYNYWAAQGGRAVADEYSARPGYSEHQTGLAIDFSTRSGASLHSFTGTPAQKWLLENAWQYGYIERYTGTNAEITGYKPESWHYRYVGKESAKLYRSSSAGSLEQFWNIPGGLY